MPAWVRGVAVLVCLSTISIFLPVKADDTVPSRVTEHTVNGYRVLLMDTQAGSQVAMSYSVPLGHMYDPVRTSGRAHLFEHMMLKGNSKYPGYHTLNKKVVSLGGSKNAYTSPSITNYFVVVPEENAAAAIDVLTASLTGLEWNLETFQSERRVVINEIVKEYLSRSGLASYSMPHRHLLPNGHPQQRVFFGDLESLSSMAQEDLMELYFENYRPENILVIVTGNFSKGHVSRDQILAALHQSLGSNAAQREQMGWKTRVGDLTRIQHPPLESKLPGHVLYVGGVEPGSGVVFQYDFPEAANTKTFLIMELLKAYFKLPNHDSLHSILVHGSPALALEVDISTTPLPNRQTLEVCVSLTEEGFNRRHQVMEEFYKSLHTVATNGIPVELRSAIESRLVAQHERGSRNAQTLATQMQQTARLNDPDLNHLRWREAFSKISNDEIKAFAKRAFAPLPAVASVFSRTVTSPLVDPDFRRPYRVEDEREWFNRLHMIWSGQTDLPLRTPAPLQGPDLEVYARHRESTPRTRRNTQDQIIVESLPEQHKGAIVVQLAGRVPSQRERLALSLWSQTYKDRFRENLYVMSAMDIQSGVTFDGTSLNFNAEGSSSESLKALRWHIHNWSQHVPSREEFESTRARVYQSTEEDRFEKFSSSLAIDLGRQLIFARPDHIENLNHIQSISYDEMIAAATQWMKRLNRNFVLVGGFGDAEVTLLGQDVDLITDQRLSVGQSVRWTRRGRPFRENLTAWEEAPLSHEIMNFGVSRSYAGPQPENMQDVAAMTVLGRVLGREVLNLNRSERNLGYVHTGVFAQPARGERYFFHFYGGTDESEERLGLTIEGWEQVLSRMQNRTLTQDGFVGDIRATVAQMSTTPPRLIDRAARHIMSLNIWGHAQGRAELLEAIKGLSAEQIDSAGDQYLGADRPHLQTIVSRQVPQSCEHLLQSTEEVRRRLR